MKNELFGRKSEKLTKEDCLQLRLFNEAEDALATEVETAPEEIPVKPHSRKKRGFIQTDGYVGYDVLGRRPGICHVGWFAHARRMFVRVVNARKKKKKSKDGNAETALEFIRKLYALEKKAKRDALDPDQIYRLRQEEAKPVPDEFKTWLDSRSGMTPPQVLLGKAISYTFNQWGRLVRCIESGHLPIDNNRVENAIRPFVVGRKNWLFSGVPSGAKACGLEPYFYLRYVFENCRRSTVKKDTASCCPKM